jgi:hypothetical protein
MTTQENGAVSDDAFDFLKSDNGFPRRSRVDLWTQAERAIADAVTICETTLPADLLETDAIILLGKARDKVGQLVDREIRAGRMSMPVQSNADTTVDGRTHHDECWRSHLDCAIRRVEQLEKEGRLLTGADVVALNQAAANLDVGLALSPAEKRTLARKLFAIAGNPLP